MEKFSMVSSKFILAFILIAVPLFPKFPFIRVPGTFVAIRLEDFLIFLAAFTLLFNLNSKFRDLLKDNLWKSICFYLFIGLLSFMSGILVSKTISPAIGLLHFLRRVEYFIPFFVAYYFLKKKRNSLDFFIKTLVGVVIIVFLYGLGQKYFSLPVIITQNEEYSKGVALRYIPGSHLNSTFAGHYDLGTFLVLVLPIIITLIILLKTPLTRLVLLLTLFSGLWLLVNTASRISLLAYLVAACTSIIFIKKYKLIPVVVIISLLFIGFSGNLISRYSRIIEVTKEKVFKISDFPKTIYALSAVPLPTKKIATPTPTPIPVFEDRSTNIRLNVEWPRAIRAFLKNPLLGTGYSSISLATDNDYLRLLGETGVLGFFSFFLIFVNLLIVFFKRFPLTDYFSGVELAFISGVFGALPGIFINALFIDVFEASKFAIIFWMLVGFAVALLKQNEKFHKQNPSR